MKPEEATRVRLFSILCLLALSSTACAIYCSQCGTKNADDANFCYKCGARLSSPADGETQPIAPPKPKPGEVTTNSIGMKLVWIPPGEFLMGERRSPKEMASRYGGRAPWYRDNYPQRKIGISKGFWMGQCEVTQAQYRKFKENMDLGPYEGDSLPAAKIRWDKAIEFCNCLSVKEGLEPCIAVLDASSKGAVGVLETIMTLGDTPKKYVIDWDAVGYRLPTEAEWEYACRAATTTDFSFGDNMAVLGDYAWFAGNSDNKPHPVGTKKPNAFGLYDMHGNLQEWCSDWYWDEYYKEPPSTDPRGPEHSTYRRVVRGGCYESRPLSCMSSFRAFNNPTESSSDSGHEYIGFRVVLATE
jgi:formylglycine-generating enzyme required for sulfatase activity